MDTRWRGTRVARFLTHSSAAALQIIAILLALAAITLVLLFHTANTRLRRDLARLVLEDRLEILESARWRVAQSDQMLRAAEDSPEPPHDRPYVVVSLEERRLWYKLQGAILFAAQVATGSGKTLDKESGSAAWKFETPRGRLVVQSKEEAPVWAPPDWHYVE